MKLNLNKHDLAKVTKILQTKNENINLSSYFLEYIYDYATPLSKDEINHYIQGGLSEEDAFKQALIYDLDLEELDEKSALVVIEGGISLVQKLNINKYTQNPYYKNLKIAPSSYKNWKLCYEKYSPYELFIANDVLDLGNYKEGLQLGYFSKEFPFLCVVENNTIWMSVTPNEIDTMEKDILEAKGNVLTFGLGLGYYAYMCSIKEDVKKVTIVEKDKKVIELFNKFILPHFETKNKIEIINEDAYAFLKKENELKKYDYIYVDIWHGAEDGLYHYLRFKEYEKKYNIEFSYWLEDSLISYFRRIILTLIEENLDGFTDSNYLESQNDYDELVNSIYNKTKELSFNTFKELDDFLNLDSLKEFLTK